MMKNDHFAYAASFCSYILENVPNIRSVILFGSASRGDISGSSDIDIFIDTQDEKKDRIKKIAFNFQNTQASKNWALKGIHNPFSIIIGNLEGKEWVDLKRSIITDGVVLFGKYKSKPEKLNQYMLVSYSNIKDAKKRVKLYRALFGYKISGKKYEGIMSKSNGLKFGSGIIAVPIDKYKELADMFNKLKITPKIVEIWMG